MYSGHPAPNFGVQSFCKPEKTNEQVPELLEPLTFKEKNSKETFEGNI